jgi:hypothetical protein
MFRTVRGLVLSWSFNSCSRANFLRKKFAQEPPITDEPNVTLSVAIMPAVVRHDGHLVEFWLLSSVLSWPLGNLWDQRKAVLTHQTHARTRTHTHTPPAAVRTFLSVKFQFWWTVFDPEAISSLIFNGSTQTLNTTYFIWSIAWLRQLTSILTAQTIGVWRACVVYITFGFTPVRGVAFQKAVIYIRVVSEYILSRFNFMYIYYGYENDFSMKFIAAWE